MLRETISNEASLETPTIQMPPLELPTAELAALPLPEPPSGSSLILPANPLADMTDDLVDAFVECTLYEDAIPEEALAEATIPNAATLATVAAAAAMPRGRDSIATLLGVMPLIAQVYAAPSLVPTELVDRVQMVQSVMIVALVRRRWWHGAVGMVRQWWTFFGSRRRKRAAPQRSRELAPRHVR